MPGTTAQALLDEAIKAGSARDYGRAVDILTALIAEGEAPVEALLFLGRSYHALGESGKAVAAFRAFLRAGGDEAAGGFFLGRSYLAAGRLSEASQCFKRSLEADPDSAAAWALLGAAQLKLRRSKLALSCLEKAVGLAPDDRRIFRGYVNALFVRACRLLAKGDADMARQMLGFVIDNGLDGAAPRLWRARAYRELGRFNEALADCEAAIRQSPDDGSLLWLRAGLLLSSGREAEALEEFEALRGEYPELPGLPPDERSLARLRASLAFRDERWKEAANEALGLLKQTPGDASLRAIVAESLRNLGQLERSMNHWQRAIEADPDAAEFRLGLALTLYGLEDYEGALGQAEKARRLGADPEEVDYCSVLSAARAGASPEALIPRLQDLIRKRGADPLAMFALAEALYRSGRPDLAAGWFDKVLYLIPDHELSLLYRISIAESLGDTDAEAAAGRDYLDAFPDNTRIRRDLVSLLMRLGKWEEAATALEEGLSIGDEGDKSRRILALAYRNAGRFREAAIIYRDLLRVDPTSTELLLALAYCLERDGKGDFALALLEKAPEAAKQGAGPWIVLGLLYERRGMKEKAVDALRTATDLEPSNARAWKDLGLLYLRMGLTQFSSSCLEHARKLGAVISDSELAAAKPRTARPPAAKASRPAPAPAAAGAKPASPTGPGDLPRPLKPPSGNKAGGKATPDPRGKGR
jgi:tetratricopeptide (TPR) repeat protein